MKTITILLHYTTTWGQYINITNLNTISKGSVLRMTYTDHSIWSIELEIPKKRIEIEFSFSVMENGELIQTEKTTHSHRIGDTDRIINCKWQEKSKQHYFQTSMFSNSIFKQELVKQKAVKGNQLVANCKHVDCEQELVISGECEYLGSWDESQALSLVPIAKGKWSIEFNRNLSSAYKYAIRDKKTKKIIEWEQGENRFINVEADTIPFTKEESYRKEWIDWKASGVAIPVFSLRSNLSFGIGDFSDLTLLVDWAQESKMTVVQLLPINDTTSTHSWQDSYPYNAISIYALHPIYLGIHEYPLKDKKLNNCYKKQAAKLNSLTTVDYNSVIKLKTEYLKVLYDEIGELTLNTKGYKKFEKENTDWLHPYATFCYIRDKYKTSKIADWGEFAIYNKKEIERHFHENKDFQASISIVFFIQYLLHQQLTNAKNYAHQKGIVLKGDIPIGVSPNSVEAWTEPHLFNLDCQTGAPPDDFSVNGQNWGFPTYNWKKMEEDNYRWWTKRFQKMSDYFDAYRIDHILGFFRIWEIPATSAHGLLGYFSPALPLSALDIRGVGIEFEEKEHTTAKIHKDDIESLFLSYSSEVLSRYLKNIDQDYFTLKEEVNTQQKIKILLAHQQDQKSNVIREGLYHICNEVLFIRDKYETDKFHPRISLQNTLLFNRLDESNQQKLHNVYTDYFYHRHSQFWQKEAMTKLPTLIHSTEMLVCGEDLGMVPESVPSVMRELQILSLEIQRMPKEAIQFTNLATLPYLSVSTTSTHDMSPLRMWWEENQKLTQDYYNNCLKREGIAPKECSTDIVTQIIAEHLKSPAMLTILPLQDWLATSEKLKRKSPEEERINEPSNPQHNWNYRMHISLENLIEEKEFSSSLRLLNEENGR